MRFSDWSSYVCSSDLGDVRNAAVRSMYVRLNDSPKGPAGKWTDAATGEHGDLLNAIRESHGLVEFKDVAEEARRFLNLPHPEPEQPATRRTGKIGRAHV